MAQAGVRKPYIKRYQGRMVGLWIVGIPDGDSDRFIEFAFNDWILALKWLERWCLRDGAGWLAKKIRERDSLFNQASQ